VIGPGFVRIVQQQDERGIDRRRQAADASSDGNSVPHAMPPGGAEVAIRLLRKLRTGDERDQQETWNLLVRALGEERASYRKLLP
jgi:hypothetical protein